MKTQQTIPPIIIELKKRRLESKMSQRVVAQLIGTTASAVARLEAGGGKRCHSPSLRTLNKYAAVFKCQIKITLKDIV